MYFARRGIARDARGAAMCRGARGAARRGGGEARERTNETNGIDRASEGWIARAARRSCEFFALHVCYAMIAGASSRVPIEEQQPERGDEQNQRDVALRASLSRDGFLHLHVAHV